MNICVATRADFPHLVRLNKQSEHFLSPLSPERLELLFNEAAYCRVVQAGREVVAFLLAFREGCTYDSVNYRWFAEQFERFLYIDRVVVSNAYQGQGVGKILYDDIFAFARQTDAQQLTCEFDIDPPNEASRRFHQRYGFTELGSQAVAGGKKMVSLQAVSLR
ncbi:MAG: GNAT family N-acetyltransferase [Rhodocyclaceae bacterium]|nr:GNAT family N-acetyltransferase [Rhodocyclaceae bacterium]